MRTLHHVQSLNRADGGLPVAVVGLCEHLGDATIVTGVSKDQIPVSTSISRLDVPFQNTPLSHFLSSPPFEIDSDFEIFHQHGLWTRSARTLAASAENRRIPMVVSPHGMLEPWALRHHKFRKKIAWKWFQEKILTQAIAFHATSEMEAGNIRNLGFTQPIAVIPNGVPEKNDVERTEKNCETRVAIFLSRIHSKKGLPTLIDAWEAACLENWRLEIYGGGDSAYVQKIRSLAANSKTISVCGPITDDGEKWNRLAASDLFILPSYSENFGIVVAEALEAGTPVITTTGTPWKILEASGCGWWVEPSPDSIAGALRDATSRSTEELHSMGKIGKTLVEKQFRWDLIGKKMETFYRWILDEGDRPEFVIP